MSGEIRLPNISGRSDAEKVQQISDYLYMLARQLRYSLNNLGQENFSEGVVEAISKEIREPIAVLIQQADGRYGKLSLDAEGLKTKIAGTESKQSALEQKVDSFTLEVKNGKDSATLVLKAGEAELSSGQIRFEGVVTFTSDEEGASVIDGGTVYAKDLRSDRVLIAQREGVGAQLEPGFLVFRQGKFTADGAQTDVCTIGVVDGNMIITAGSDSMIGISSNNNLALTGRRIDLFGEVYVNGTKIG